MDCLLVRDRLPEYAVSTLPEKDRATLERHLEWCAGCRKESAELREAAAMVGLSLPSAAPKPDLEQRVVDRVRSAATTRTQPRRRFVVLVAATVVTAMVAAAGLGWGVFLSAKVNTAEGRADAATQQAHRYLDRLRTLLQQLAAREGGGEDVRLTTLRSAARVDGGGAGLVLVSPRSQDWALVVVGGLSTKRAPYRVWLTTGSGHRMFVGRIDKVRSSDGGAQLGRPFHQDLAPVRHVVIKDARGVTVLSGVIAPTPRTQPA
jgi:hypothetical protein